MILGPWTKPCPKLLSDLGNSINCSLRTWQGFRTNCLEVQVPGWMCSYICSDPEYIYTIISTSVVQLSILYAFKKFHGHRLLESKNLGNCDFTDLSRSVQAKM